MKNNLKVGDKVEVCEIGFGITKGKLVKIEEIKIGTRYWFECVRFGRVFGNEFVTQYKSGKWVDNEWMAIDLD